ncbi:GerAB/ArcD/ProY family transporter [Oceanirhabdus seepicola]|uniref:Endospore germination permease n=1 Tax=Oceanirhabdus seepicola TaxID=2828781 RepID=A0A9J6NVN8_9CLOT|nr:endospore germination permease [Oceanirhabdus seepicola]MCM1988559.1 endospore germination permease [Oceanirhabdus seepicola]
MKKEVISDRQGISIMVLFLMGTSIINISGLSAGKDIWLANIIAIIMAIPIMFIYARLQSLFLNKDLFDVIEMCLGKILGKTIIIALTLFAFFEMPLSVRNFAQFPNIVSLVNTPQIIGTIIFMCLCVWIVKAGIQVVGEWASFFVRLFIIIPLITIALVLNILNIDNFRPVLNYGIKPVFKGAYEVFLFPFTQTIAFVMAYSNFTHKKTPYKLYLIGLLIGGIEILVLSSIAVMVLGVNEASRLYYPNYEIWLRINIGDAFQRTEIIQGAMFTICAFIKVSIFLMATCKGISKIFKFDDYKVIVTPIALLIIILACYQFDSIMHYNEWGDKVWYSYVIIFQVILPIIIWIVAEIKKKRIIGIE